MRITGRKKKGQKEIWLSAVEINVQKKEDCLNQIRTEHHKYLSKAPQHRQETGY